MRAPLLAVLALWLLWLASWLMARGWTNPTVSRPRPGAQVLYEMVVEAGFVLMVAPTLKALGPPLWRLRPALGWSLVGLALIGFGICWWARLYLAGAWSWSVTLKENHAVIDTGPYRFVRHPIYTGVLLAAAATAVLEAKALSILGFATMAAGFWIKARLEEAFLRAELGAGAYDAYAARTGMLLPRL